MFKRGSASLVAALCLMALSIVLMVLDHRVPAIHRLRNQISVAVLPLQLAVNAPIKWVHWVVSSITTQEALLEDNAQLRAHQLLLQSKLQKLLTLERENARLKALLKSTNKVSGRVQVAQLLAVSLDPALQQVILNKGTKDQVYLGQPVLDANGVMGQVVDVAPFTSKVMLITDHRSAIPVRDVRNGLRAIAVGTGALGQLSLIEVPNLSDIRVGDVFVSSGLGLRYPEGYPVGTVAQVKHHRGQSFAEIALVPAAHIDKTQQVLLTWPNQAKLRAAVKRELQQPLKSAGDST